MISPISMAALTIVHCLPLLSDVVGLLSSHIIYDPPRVSASFKSIHSKSKSILKIKTIDKARTGHMIGSKWRAKCTV